MQPITGQLRSKAKLLALHLYVKSSMEQAAMVGKPGPLILVLSNAQVLDIFSTELEDMKQMYQAKVQCSTPATQSVETGSFVSEVVCQIEPPAYLDPSKHDG